jgi:hypothetical protein
MDKAVSAALFLDIVPSPGPQVPGLCLQISVIVPRITHSLDRVSRNKNTVLGRGDKMIGVVLVVGVVSIFIVISLHEIAKELCEANRLKEKFNHLKKLELRKQGISEREIHEATYGK